MGWLARIGIYCISYILVVNGLSLIRVDGIVGLLISVCVAFVATVYAGHYLAARKKISPPEP